MTGQSNSLPSINHDADDSTRSSQGPLLIIEVAQKFNFAAWQNSVPLLRKIEIANPGEAELNHLILEMKASPGFARSKRWTIDRVSPSTTVALRDIDLEIDPEYLDRLDEAERGVLSFRLTHLEVALCESIHGLRILARDEWGGMSTMGELLPAFVTPNDPSLAAILKSAAGVLAEHGHSPALDGYQSDSPNRAWLLAASLWSAVAGRSLVYANPPSSFEVEGQKTRPMTTVLRDGLATCLDLSLLFASGLEAIGLNSVLVMTRGHCFAGAWLTNKTFPLVVGGDCGEVRKAIAANELVVFETTLVTHRPAARFPDAIHSAERAVSEERESDFVAVIDVSRARMSQVLPLASHSSEDRKLHEEEGSSPPPLPQAPGFDATPAALSEERPQTPAGRIDRWQRKLLDLSLRNRLLNFRPSRQSAPVLCPELSKLEDRLAQGARMRLVSLPQENPLGLRDAELHHRRTQKDLDSEFARQALERDQIACPLSPHELDGNLTGLFRKVRNDLAEGGSNTLYLAVGFLRWKQQATDQRTYRAPLLLVPVKLTRRSAASPFYLSSHEDEIRFNATLLQMLKKDFDCDLTQLESNLPTDDSGVDVGQVFHRVRQGVREIPGFEVVEEAALASFSFAKYLMWKDLVDRVEQLEQNRVVRHLIHDPEKTFVSGGSGSIPQPHEIDKRYLPEELVHPLPADSSQLAVVMAAAEGHDLVIVGPPGTGKSQTIANLIAQCLAIGKTVLFVAEKTAALDVVYRRLREQGLGDCCVELHSNKAERRRFLDQLEASWTNRREAVISDWVKISDELRVRRDQLNSYAEAVHAAEENGWTAYLAMGECARGRDLVTPALPWPRGVCHDRTQYAQIHSTVLALATTFEAIPREMSLPRMEATEWSMAWETGLLDACHRLTTASATLAKSMETFSGILEAPSEPDGPATYLAKLTRLAREISETQFPPEEFVLHPQLDELQSALTARQRLLDARASADERLSAAVDGFCAALGTPSVVRDSRRSLFQLANELVRKDPPPAEIVFHPQFETLSAALANRPALLSARDESLELLKSRRYSPALVNRMPVDTIEQHWTRAASSIWPLSAFRINATRRKLKAYLSTGGSPEPEVDVPLLREYRESCRRLDENLAALGLPVHFLSLVEKDSHALDDRLKAAARIRDAFRSAGLDPDIVKVATNGSLKPLAETARKLYPPGKELETLRQYLEENLANLILPANLKAVIEKDGSVFDESIRTSQRIRESVFDLGGSIESGVAILRSLLASTENVRRHAAADVCYSMKEFEEAWNGYAQYADVPPVAKDSMAVISDAAKQAQCILDRRTALRPWTAWMAVSKQAERLGLSAFVTALETGELRPEDAPTRFSLAYARWWLPSAVDRSLPLRTFQRFLHEKAIEDFRRLDDAARREASWRVRKAVVHGLPAAEDAPRKSELGLLRHQMSLKRPSRSIRELIAGMPEAFGKLAPCLLMSPLSIAQYLPPGQSQFDVVIFDEASQIPTWDAIGAIARGRQTIIVGDPKQLPPTNFFGRAENDEDNLELEDHEKDLESILDEAHASGLPKLQLNWHYRSRHESLIAFSNRNYYGNHLITFPAAESVDRGVSFKLIPKGTYDRGKSRTNRQEAEAIVADAVQRMKRCLRRPVSERLTYGVVTFNSQQQQLIQDLLDEELRQNPQLEWFFSDDRYEPTMVKNLENVQGDERDVMLFSITFGFDAAGKFSVDFGAINRDGGERRLNVAITRARRELVVFASFLPDQLRAERSSARGVHDLKAFLEYARSGTESLISRSDGSIGGFESPLEEAIATALEARGWRIDPQVGISSYRIDLGVVHPDRPGAYLAGVECDGATYHRSAMARDRDKTRQLVLENLGWRIVRVWSTDWWYDSDAATEQLHAALDALLQRDRESPAPGGEIRAIDDTSLPAVEGIDDANDSASVSNGSESEDRPEMTIRPQLVARQAPAVHSHIYLRADLGDASANQSQFFASEYSEVLTNMARAVLDTQGPILEEALAREVALAHGFQRTGGRIRQRVLVLLPQATITKETVGNFLWPGSKSETIIPFRYAATVKERRSLDEIAMPELLGLVREHPGLAASDDPALALAREIGLARLARGARERLELALELYAELCSGSHAD